MKNTVMLIAVGIVGIPAVYGLIAGVIHLVVAVCHFFGAIATEPAPFLVGTLLLSAVAAGCAASVWHQLSGNSPWYVQTWSDWKDYHKTDVLHYGIAALGTICGAIAFALLFFCSPVLREMGFGVFVCLVGGISAGMCAFRIAAELVSSTYHLVLNQKHGCLKRSR